MSLWSLRSFVAGCRVGQSFNSVAPYHVISASVRLLWHDETARPAVSRATGGLDY